MVRIRLTRVGTTKRPFYRIVATNSRSSRGGEFIEILGTYDPRNFSVRSESTERPAKGTVVLKTDKISAWIKKGALVSDTVRGILSRQGFFKTETKAA